MTLAGLHVLLAEDNPTNQLVAAQMLESLGATVGIAVDGAEALELLEREQFDVALVDIEMPRVNGIEMIKAVRAAPGPLAELPLIALTAYVMREHRAAIDAAGADGVIAKPILSIEQFGADIRRYMRKRAGAARPATDPADRADAGARAPADVIDQDIYDGLAEAIGPTAMSELLEKVAADVESAGARFRQGLAGADLAETRAATHILISVAGAIGATRVQSLARALNTAGHVGDIQTLGRDAPLLAAEIASLLEQVQSRRLAAAHL